MKNIPARACPSWNQNDSIYCSIDTLFLFSFSISNRSLGHSDQDPRQSDIFNKPHLSLTTSNISNTSATKQHADYHRSSYCRTAQRFHVSNAQLVVRLNLPFPLGKLFRSNLDIASSSPRWVQLEDRWSFTTHCRR